MTQIRIFEDRFDSILASLPWRHFVAPGVILLDDDDALVAAIEYRGRDQSVLSDDDLSAMAARVSNLLKPFDGGGITFHFEVQKRETKGYPTGSGRHRVAALVDGERRRRLSRVGGQYRFRTFLAVTYTPPTAVARRLRRFLYRSPEAQTRTYYDEHVIPFRELVLSLAGHLNASLGFAKMLDDDELTTTLYNLVDIQGNEYVKAPPLPGFPIKYVMQTLGEVTGDPPYRTNGDPNDEYHVKVFGIGGYPVVSDAGMLAAMQDVPAEFRLSFRFEALSEAKAQNVLKWMFRTHDETSLDWRSWLSSAAGGGEVKSDPVAMMRAMDAEAARVEAGEPGTVTGWMTVTGVVWGKTKDDADNAFKAVERAFRGFTLKGEGWNSDLAFLGTLFGHVRPNARRAPLPHTVLSDLVLLTSPWTGSEPNRHLRYDSLSVLDSPGGNSVKVDFFDGKDGSVALVGPQRSGKSAGAALFGSQWLERITSERPRVIWVDADSKLSTAMVATWMHGGEFMSFGTDDIALQPLAGIDTKEGFAWGKRVSMAIWDRLGVIGPDMPRDRVMVLTEDALRRLASSPVNERTLSGLADVIQSNRLRRALRSHYCKGSSLGHLMDADRDRIQDADWITVDLTKLTDNADGGDIAPVLMTLFRKFYDLTNDARPTLFIVDEFKQMSAIHEELDELRRRGPKRNVCMMFITHKLDDFKDTEIWPILKTTKAYMLFGDVTAKGSAALSEIDVTRTEVQRIAEAGERGEHGWSLYKTTKGSRVVKIEMTPLELAVCGCGATDREAAIEIMERYGRAGFPAAWLRHKGFADEASSIEEKGGLRYAAE